MTAPDPSTLPGFEALPPPSPGEVIDYELPESTPALLGLRRFIVETRLARNEEILEKRESSDVVIKAAARESRTMRGFKTQIEIPYNVKELEVEPDEHTPISPTERLAAWWRHGQALKWRKLRYELTDLESNYLEKRPAPDTEPPIDSIDFGSALAKRAEIQRRKTAERDRGKVTYLGTPKHRERVFGVRDDDGNWIVKPARMRPSQRKLEKNDIREQHHIREEINELQEKIDRGASGETLHGKYRYRQIQKSRRKVRRLERRLEELRSFS